MADRITVSVDPDVADVYRSASDDERSKLDLLINLYLREATESRTSLSIRACRGPKDGLILELAVGGNADFVVTGDANLLLIDSFRGLRIPTSADLRIPLV